MQKLLQIVKLFIPSSSKLASLAADKTQSAFNGYAADKSEIVQKWANLTNQVAAVSAQLSEMAKDAKIDDIERDALAELFKPVFDRVLEVI